MKIEIFRIYNNIGINFAATIKNLDKPGIHRSGIEPFWKIAFNLKDLAEQVCRNSIENSKDFDTSIIGDHFEFPRTPETIFYLGSLCKPRMPLSEKEILEFCAHLNEFSLRYESDKLSK